MMFKIFTILVYISLTVDKLTAQYNSTRIIAVTLDTRFTSLYGNVIGDDRVLFGGLSFSQCGICCDNKRAFAGHPPKIDLVIALDESGSVGQHNFEIMKSFIEDLTSHFVVSYSATRVAIVTWSTQTTLQFDFNEYINHEGVKKGIAKIIYNGGLTATGDALNYIRKNLFSQSPRDAYKVLFILTDGKSNMQIYNPVTEAKLLKDSGVEIFTLGIGVNVNDYELIQLASQQTSTHKFRLENFSDLSSLSHLISNSGCTSNTIVHDACGRKCKCRSGKLMDCKRIRKNFLDMTDLERCRYIRAVKKVSTTQPFKSEYDQLIGIHEQVFFSGIHNGNFFLPWHRWYILAFENILRKVDCRVTVPYWDWSLDSQNPFTSDVWNSNVCKHTGLGGNGNPSDSCVTAGPFATSRWQLTPSAQNSCLRRGFSGTFPDCTAVQDVLDVTTANFGDFLMTLERLLHNNIHARIGGTMAGRESSNAPEFFFHHGFVDKIWGDWQEKGINFRQHEYYQNTMSMPNTIYSPRDVHNLDDQPYCVKVCYQEPKRHCKINGRDVSILKVASMSIQERLKLNPNPLPEILEEAFTIFAVPQSVVKRLPEIALSVFGVPIKIRRHKIPIEIKEPKCYY